MDKIRCNKCGRVLKVENDIAKEDYIYICKQWGYFSDKDGKTQEFVVCEACMKLIEQDFVIPPFEYDIKKMI